MTPRDDGEKMISLSRNHSMDWEALKAQLEVAVRQEAVKALDDAIQRLQELKVEYQAGAPIGAIAATGAEAKPVAIPQDQSPFSPQEQHTQVTRTADFWSPGRTTARSLAQRGRREREKQEPKQFDPKTCVVCHQEFTPTHHLQKKCESCRTFPATQKAAPKPLEPRKCSVCGIQFTPTHHMQKTCPEHRTGMTARKINAIDIDVGLTPEERAWAASARQTASRLSKRRDAPIMHRAPRF